MTKYKEQIKAAWVSGDRVKSFTLYLMKCYPDTFGRYISQVPKMEAQLNALHSINEFKTLLPNLVRRVNSGQVAITRLPWRGDSIQPDDQPVSLHQSSIAFSAAKSLAA